MYMYIEVRAVIYGDMCWCGWVHRWVGLLRSILNECMGIYYYVRMSMWVCDWLSMSVAGCTCNVNVEVCGC